MDDAPEILVFPAIRVERAESMNFEGHCPVCGTAVEHEKCKVVCRSDACVYRIIFTCSEF
jgi:hypothetical protein